jgi:tetratricopeptide (TPR) repeat protein
MKKHISLAALLTLLLGLCAIQAGAQNTGTLKGVAKDQAGKPIADATVEFTNIETGRKITLKTDKKGEYLSVGVPAGNYNATLAKDGKVIDGLNKIPVGTTEQTVNFDLAKDIAPVSEEQKQKQEAQRKDAEKIKGLNSQLATVRDMEKAGNYDQAVDTLKPLAEANPTQDLLWAYLGDAYRGAKKYPEAVDAFQKALAIKDTASYHSGLADAYAKSGQLDKAVEEYNKAAQMDQPNAAMYYFNEGAILTNANKTDEAVTAFDKSIQADPTRADSYYFKGSNLLAKATLKGDKMVPAEGTVEALNKYLELAPDGKHASEAKAILESLGAPVQTSFGKGKTSKTPPPKK